MSLQMLDEYTSTGQKFFAHEQAMMMLKNGFGQPVTTHVMSTDLCNHDCTFCSVHNRPTNVLPLADILAYLDILRRFGLKAVILSGGGNPILYKHGFDNFNDLVSEIHDMGLEVGLITNGLSMTDYDGRRSWKNVDPETLDKLTWVRISMAGLDHVEKEVFIPDIDRSKTTLGLSYIYYDEGREDWLCDRIGHYVQKYKPDYVRLVADCLQPSCRPRRLEVLQTWADKIDPEVVFVQDKPTKAPNACYLGYVHPVLNSCGGVWPCDSAVLQDGANRTFHAKWRICHWTEVEKLYTEPVHSLVDSKKMCQGCVFFRQNEILEGVVNGTIEPTPPLVPLLHSNFV